MANEERFLILLYIYRMRILITGSDGFVGSHSAEHFLSAVHEVLIVDNLSTGVFSNISNLLDSTPKCNTRSF